MAQFEFKTQWLVEASLESVWDAIHTVQEWPQWWSYVKDVTEIERGDTDGLGTVHRFHWKTRLPYSLSFESRVVRIEKPVLLEAAVDGELMGRGVWRLSRAGEVTQVCHDWEVTTSKAWMTLLAPLALPVFRWNHVSVMREGGEGLARRLGTRLRGSET